MDHFINNDDYVDLLSNEKVKFIIYALFFIEWLYLKVIETLILLDFASSIIASNVSFFTPYGKKKILSAIALLSCVTFGSNKFHYRSKLKTIERQRRRTLKLRKEKIWL